MVSKDSEAEDFEDDFKIKYLKDILEEIKKYNNGEWTYPSSDYKGEILSPRVGKVNGTLHYLEMNISEYDPEYDMLSGKVTDGRYRLIVVSEEEYAPFLREKLDDVKIKVKNNGKGPLIELVEGEKKFLGKKSN